MHLLREWQSAHLLSIRRLRYPKSALFLSLQDKAALIFQVSGPSGGKKIVPMSFEPYAAALPFRKARTPLVIGARVQNKAVTAAAYPNV